MGSIIASIFAAVALLISAFVSGSEIAFFSLTQAQRENIENETKKEAVESLLADPERLLATILITNNLVNVTIVILCNYVMNQVLEFNSGVVNFIFQTIILTFLILLFGEILPKLYATNHNLKFAIFAAPGIKAFSKLFSPLSGLMVKSSGLVNKMVSVHSDEISKEDLSQALEIADVKADDEKELLEGILKFGGTTVTEIMTPRVDIEDINYNENFEKVVAFIIETGYSRLPIYLDSPDNIKGILYAKDLLPYIGKVSKNFKWQELIREPYFVPDTRMIDDLLEDFRKKQIHMAIVVDEYGGTQGIVTLEDVLEEIVGDINDEYDTEEKFYQKLPDNSYIFEGKTLLNDFYKVTDIDENQFEKISEDAETVAGLLLAIKGDFLKENEIIVYGGCRFKVLDVEKHRIATVKVIVPPKETSEND